MVVHGCTEPDSIANSNGRYLLDCSHRIITFYLVASSPVSSVKQHEIPIQRTLKKFSYFKMINLYLKTNNYFHRAENSIRWKEKLIMFR
jgi:hypothetical protein